MEKRQVTPMLILQGDPEIVLILFQLKDAPSLYHLINSSRNHLEPWLPWIREIHSLQAVEGYITRSLFDFSKGRQLHFGIWHQARLTGSVTVERIDTNSRIAELGYWLAPAYTGKGWMKRSVSQVIQYLFERHNINRVEIRCETDNKASNQVAQRLGFQLEGTLRQGAWKDGRFVDLHLYSLLRCHWKSPVDHCFTQINPPTLRT
ncbi:GNAT family N-acetyltransferase [Desmospora activa]|uniref:Ribosomal-protein-serine acetyltransferase n=1 Tax=Desmospora activa DSM 45169 TaxID=1121389 RepID=A0A2T4ZDH8_9BACL|nr:GNAT family protein [Desmospora activa]PTM59937.1 ribosomal-protein-serine acetyltransferase [Desmospora activa DSM 45169]